VKRVVALVALAWALACVAAHAAPSYVDVAVNSSRQTTTATGFSLPSFFGSAGDHHAVFRFAPLAPGGRYEVTLTYDAGSDIGYGHSWVDGDPMGQDYWSFVGIGTGTGTRELKGKEDKFLFTVDPRSTSNVLYLVVRSNKPWKLAAALTDRASGLTRDSRDKWGYTYVTDFDFDRTAPFLLTRGSPAAPVARSASGYVDVANGETKSALTATGYTWMPGFLGGPEGFYAVFRLGPLAAGKRYEATMTYDAGTDIGYGHSWIDGDPRGKDLASFVGIGTGTGTREMKGSQRKFLFTVDPNSTAAFVHIVLRSNKPFALTLGLTDRLSGVTPSTQDKWGYTYVTDFDADRNAPFVLTRGAAR
jgi:hypothetical protein